MRDDRLFYTCSLIEYIGRRDHIERSDLVKRIGKEGIRRIYKDADILHCEPIEKISDEIGNMLSLGRGNYDNLAFCKYNIPNYWDIGDVYSGLIADVNKDDIIDTLVEVYQSQTSKNIQDFN